MQHCDWLRARLMAGLTVVRGWLKKLYVKLTSGFGSWVVFVWGGHVFCSFSYIFDRFRPCKRMRKHAFAGRNT